MRFLCASAWYSRSCRFLYLLRMQKMEIGGGTESTAQQSVVYGTYDEDGWKVDSSLNAETAVKHYPSAGEVSKTGANITYSKTAVPAAGENTYDITLNVSATVKKAAVVLVIDASKDACECCVECGWSNLTPSSGETDTSGNPLTGHSSSCAYYKSTNNINVTENQTFLASEKRAALEFINNFAGSVSGTGRFVQIVSYQGTANIHGTWNDVSTENGKAAAINAINSVSYNAEAEHATNKNLEQGLSKALSCFKDKNSAVANMAAENKYTVVMTNSRPDAYGEACVTETGKTGNDISYNTKLTAAELKKECTLCTIYNRNHVEPRLDGNGFDTFLSEIATSSAWAEDRTAQGNEDHDSWQIKKVGKEFVSKLNVSSVIAGFTVTDPMGKYVTLESKNLTDSTITNENGIDTITWTPTAPSSTDGDTISFTLKYTIKLNTGAEGFEYSKYYPTNGDTTLSFADGSHTEWVRKWNEDGTYKGRVEEEVPDIVTLHFIVPGVKAAEYDVTYKYVDEDFNEIEDSTLKAPVDPKSYAVGAEFSVVAAPAKTDIPGYDFVDWYLDEEIAVKTGEVLDMVKGGMTIYGKLTRSETIYIVNYIWNGEYIADSKTFGCKVGDVIKYGGVATDNSVKPVEIEGYTAKPVALSELEISETATQNVINFYYYKDVEITAKSDSVVYDGKEHSVSGFTGAPKDADFSAIEVGAKGTKVDVYPADFAANTVGTVDKTENYIITKATNGQLEITSRPYRPNPSITDKITVEITGNSDSVVYDGTEHSVKDYTVKISDSRYTEKDFTFSGKALASGINAGTYEMGLKADQFKNTNARFKNVEFIIKADGVLTITQRPLTITAGSAEGIAPVTCDKYTVEGLATGDKVDSVKITGIQSEPGESPNVASDAVIKNAKGEDVTANYKITYVDGVLKAIEVLNKEIHFNYVIGYTDGTIRPNNDISRAEVATIFFRLLTDEARTQYDKTTSSFSDIKDGAWCCRAVSTLTNMGIIKGYTDGTFRPNADITRAELATIIARFAKLDVNTKTFSDINGHWAQKSIELAAGNGWINGYTDGTFRPNKSIIRAETFAMINRVLDRQTESVSDLLPTSDMNMWSDNLNENAWYYKDVQEATNYHKCDRVGDSVYEKWTEKVPDIDWASYQI